MAIAPANTELLELYEQMLLIRVFETEAERQYKAARIGGYCHFHGHFFVKWNSQPF